MEQNDIITEDNVYEKGSYLVEDDYSLRDATGQILEDKADEIYDKKPSLAEQIKEAERRQAIHNAENDEKEQVKKHNLEK